MAISVVSFSFSRAAQLEARGPSFLMSAGFLYHILSPTGLVSKLTDFLSSPSYIIVPLPTQSLEGHVWASSSGNNCHAVQRSLSSGASVYDCTAGFYLVPFCQPSLPTPIEYALLLSLEWHVWPGWRSIYNITIRLFCLISKTLIGGVLPLCRDAVGVFCSFSWLGHIVQECLKLCNNR